MMKKIRHKIRFIIYTLIISFLLSLLFQSKYTNSFELNSTDSFVNLFMSPIRPQPPPLLPSSPSFSLSTSLPLISKKLKDVEFGSYSFEEWEFERQQILNEKRKKRISYMIHSQLPTIYEEHDVLVV
ncbi:hypothetical protein RirG_204410 [Rhizophagus irregularis DAOM 197198w]|uniref:Uncharacterized protein n=1 Tax=Rhizophagus irregularis (strain DAOM 197198w) TaxID=1432141 RepID=A0A015KDV6_RHIIW|nr:hypothetical protein RirG_204410 [Rhizophagus irregularis DAOM 197198w]